MRRKLIVLVTFLGGLFFVLEFFVHKNWQQATGLALTDWKAFALTGLQIVGGVAVGLGVINLVMVHLRNVIKGRRGRVNSAALLLGMFGVPALLIYGFHTEQVPSEKTSLTQALAMTTQHQAAVLKQTRQAQQKARLQALRENREEIKTRTNQAVEALGNRHPQTHRLAVAVEKLAWETKDEDAEKELLENLEAALERLGETAATLTAANRPQLASRLQELAEKLKETRIIAPKVQALEQNQQRVLRRICQALRLLRAKGHEDFAAELHGALLKAQDAAVALREGQTDEALKLQAGVGETLGKLQAGLAARQEDDERLEGLLAQAIELQVALNRGAAEVAPGPGEEKAREGAAAESEDGQRLADGPGNLVTLQRNAANALRALAGGLKNRRDRQVAQKLKQAAEHAARAADGLQTGKEASLEQQAALAALRTARAEVAARWPKHLIQKIEDHIIYEGFIRSLDSAMFSLLAFYIATAAYRAFRVKSAEAGVMMVVAVLVMLGQIPVGVWLWEMLPQIRGKILSVLNAAAMRGVYLGVWIAGLAQSIRLWLSLDRGVLSQEEEG